MWQVGNWSLPFQLIGTPLSLFLKATHLHKLSHLPGASALLTLPVDVGDVGCAAAIAALFTSQLPTRILDSAAIERLASEYSTIVY